MPSLLLQFLSLVSLLLSYLSSISFDSIIETVALEASPSIKYLNKNKSPLYRATMKIILFALTSPLVGKISQSFHLDPFLAFTSLFWGLNLAYSAIRYRPPSHSCFRPPFLGVFFISKHFGSYRFTFI